MVPLPAYVNLHAVIDPRQSRLDHGGGRDLALPECSREQLEKQVSSFPPPSYTTTLMSIPLNPSNAENHVSEILPLCRLADLLQLL